MFCLGCRVRSICPVHFEGGLFWSRQGQVRLLDIRQHLAELPGDLMLVDTGSDCHELDDARSARTQQKAALRSKRRKIAAAIGLVNEPPYDGGAQ